MKGGSWEARYDMRCHKIFRCGGNLRKISKENKKPENKNTLKPPSVGDMLVTPEHVRESTFGNVFSLSANESESVCMPFRNENIDTFSMSLSNPPTSYLSVVGTFDPLSRNSPRTIEPFPRVSASHAGIIDAFTLKCLESAA